MKLFNNDKKKGEILSFEEVITQSKGTLKVIFITYRYYINKLGHRPYDYNITG